MDRAGLGTSGSYGAVDICGSGSARLGDWHSHHVHSINSAEAINASCSDSSAALRR